MSTPTTAIILAAGANSRFFPLNYSTHKGGISLCGLPIIIRTIQSLQRFGVKKVIVVLSTKDSGVGGLRESLENSAQGLELDFVTQIEPKGMGDAVLLAYQRVKGEDVFVLSPYHFDSHEALTGLSVHSGCAVCVAPTNEDDQYGMVEVIDGKLKHIIEKPQSATVDHIKIQSIYRLNAAFVNTLAALPPSEYVFEEALNAFASDQSVRVYRLPAALPSLKFPWHLFDMQSHLFSTLSSFTHSSAQIAKTAIIDDSHGPVVIEEGARVGDFAKIVGPAYIGKNSLVGDFSFVRGSSLEEKAQVGANTEVVRSIMMEDATLHFGYMADSILGTHVRIGAGLITANKRHDRANILVDVKGKKVDAKRNALGIVMGEGAKLGIRTNCMPGKMIGAKAVVYPGISIYENIPHEAVVKHER